MSKRNFEKTKKEKIVMFVSSALVIGACAFTGLYVSQMEQVKDDGYVVDLSELESQTDQDEVAEIDGDVMDGSANLHMEESDSSVVNSGSVTNSAVSSNETEKTDESSRVNSDSVLNKLEDVAVSESKEAVSEPKEAVTEGLSAGSGKIADITDLQFSIDETMMWPVSGDVILNYSMDKTVYFSTLDQYKYNPAIFISGQVGDNVSAAARGIVKEIGTDEEIGQYVRMELGDGYEAVYGELENVSVAQGDLVSKGQVIGTIANPTKYYTLEGANLYFAVEKDGTSVNPMEYLN